MNTDNFYKELEGRLKENSQLVSKGGLPGGLAPLAYLLGMHSWKMLVGVSLLLTVFGYLVFPGFMHKLVRVLLLMELI